MGKFKVKSSGKSYTYKSVDGAVVKILSLADDSISLEKLMSDIIFEEEDLWFCYSVAKKVMSNINEWDGTVKRKGVYSAKIISRGVTYSKSLEFRHPLLEDSEGNPGKKVKKGLGLDAEFAQMVCDEVNLLLKDNQYWTPSGRQRALRKFHTRSIEIFYDKVELYELGESQAF